MNSEFQFFTVLSNDFQIRGYFMTHTQIGSDELSTTTDYYYGLAQLHHRPTSNEIGRIGKIGECDTSVIHEKIQEFISKETGSTYVPSNTYMLHQSYVSGVIMLANDALIDNFRKQFGALAIATEMNLFLILWRKHRNKGWGSIFNR